ncbi:DUF1415 domain-containing protein [Shewanella sp. Isolate11]|uniref:DUF1415 domain-containing protein n=1 Tax=Shewanella sp. Isolate11 TaxID=2908530 RepID=UPI001EFD5029|nr:DUF1415 domain-containing protein [Shewanella sp. Isolate11]MCG9696903.1 DUF1415 domain-containing protein [Shewanella sp. Isolate11]
MSLQRPANDEFTQAIATEMEHWVEIVIMKYNICPFARKEVLANSIRYLVIEAHKLDQVLSELISECQFLDQHPEIETSLFILPRGFEGFYLYLDLVDIANDLLIEQGYEGIYQLASFHPDYCFDGEAQDSPTNYTNRAPYPTLHIIREASMELALAQYDAPESIPERNIAFAERKGSQFFIDLLARCKPQQH